MLPPALAPVQVVIVPISKNDDERARVVAEAERVFAVLRDQGIAVKLDDREGIMPGAKYYEWEARGVPLRIEIGPKDLEKESLCLVRRFVLEQEGEDEKALRKRRKTFLPRAEALESIRTILDTMQTELLERARQARARRTRVIDDLETYQQFFARDGGGFAWVHWAGDHAQEEEMAKRYETTIRCLPYPDQLPPEARGEGVCILTGQPSKQRVLMARAY